MTKEWSNLLILLGAMLMGAMTGYVWTLFGLELETAEIGTDWIGYAGTAQVLAIVLITHILPRFLHNSNLFHLHILTSLLGTAAIIGLALVGTNMWLHIPLRLLLGCGLSGTYILYEYWLNSSVTDANRGKLMASYCTCVVIGMSAGPLIVPELAGDMLLKTGFGMALFLGSLMLAFCARSHRPEIHETPPSASPWGIIALSPTVAVIGLMFGMTESTYWSFMTIFGMREGLSIENAAWLLSLISLGGFLMQLPMGWLADKKSARVTVLLATGIGVIGALALPHLIGTAVTTPSNNPISAGLTIATTPLWLFMLFWGGIMTTIYTSAIILLGHEHKAANLASATLAYQMMYGMGNIFGPMVTGNAIEAYGNMAVPTMMGLACGVSFVFTLWRTIQRKAT